MDLWCLLFVLCLIIVGSSYAELNKLNDYILHYEPVHYDTTAFHERHHRVKRSLSSILHLDFNALGRPFRIRLRPDSSAFAPDVQIENSDGSREPFDTSFMYSGELKGQAGTRVTGSVIEGIFRGVIKTPDDDYFIEPSRHYFEQPPAFHSVIYAGKHVHDLSRMKRSSVPGPHCGSADSRISEWMNKQQHSAVLDRFQRSTSDSDDFSHQYNKYSAQANRQKRDTGNSKVCTLYMQSDTMLWNHFAAGGKSDSVIKQEISAVFQTHVSGIKDIYENTVFSHQDKKITGITFSVQRIKINSTQDCPYGSNTNNNPFCNPYIDVSNFLNLNSLTNHDDFCLAYIFTYRDFADGTLGLAWVGSESKASGGICERYKTFTENDRLVKKSLNTGIVTFLNYGSRVATKVSILTFAHEVGHNFGSPHDYPAECTPYTKLGNPSGNYIMFASATSGDRANNNKFSSCSKGNITLVLDAVINKRNLKYNCFKSTGVAFCGNMLKEEGEECDCGYKDDCDDPCCNGRGTGEQFDCKRKTGTECSSADPCCTQQCKIQRDQTVVCRNETQCSQSQTCDGTNAACPASDPKPQNTPCNSKTQVCKNGECSGSICNKISWEECSVSVDLKPGETAPDRKDLCFISCRANRESICVSTVDPDVSTKAANLSDMLRDINSSEGIQKPPGAHCDNMQGYCDVFHKCRGIDADGPLARLKNLIFNQATLNTIRDWIIKYWWAVLLMGLGLILFMGIFIKVCAVHTPSSNPMRKPARPLTLRRRQQRPPPQHDVPPPQSRPMGLPKGPPPPYGAPSAPTGGPPPGKGKKRKRHEQRYQPASTDIEMHHRH